MDDIVAMLGIVGIVAIVAILYGLRPRFKADATGASFEVDKDIK
jgi:hypothetical protein